MSPPTPAQSFPALQHPWAELLHLECVSPSFPALAASSLLLRHPVLLPSAFSLQGGRVGHLLALRYVGVTFIFFLTLSCQPSEGLDQSQMGQCRLEEEGKKPGQGELILHQKGPWSTTTSRVPRVRKKSSLGTKGYKSGMEQGQGVVSTLVLSDGLTGRTLVSSPKHRKRVPPQGQRKGSRQGLGRE